MSEAFVDLGSRRTIAQAISGKPKLVTLGGDHSIALPALRALREIYGAPIAVVHFDAHLDTWHPAKYPSAWIDDSDTSQTSFFNHGSMFWLANNEGLLANNSLIHAGLRTRLSGLDESDNDEDTSQGWERISADDIDDIGTAGVIQRIMSRVGTEIPVYLSVDIDVIGKFEYYDLCYITITIALLRTRDRIDVASRN